MIEKKIYFLSISLFTLVLIVALASKSELSYFNMFVSIIIFSVGIVTVHFFNKYMKREDRMRQYRKKTLGNSSNYLEKNKTNQLSGRAEYEQYLDYQDTKLFYSNKMIVGNFSKKYNIPLAELRNHKLINEYALEFYRFLLDESDVDRDYLTKRFINIASTYHYISINPNTLLERIEILESK